MQDNASKKTRIDGTLSEKKTKMPDKQVHETETGETEDILKEVENEWGDLFASIERTYRVITGTNEKNGGPPDDGETDYIKQLMFIEHNLNYIIEVRDYLTNGLSYHDIGHTYTERANYIKEIFQFEKDIVQGKKAKRQMLQIQEEREQLEAKKNLEEQKIKDKDKLGKEGDKPKLRNPHPRTNKPGRIKYTEDPLLKFTNDELDFMYYVDGIGPESIREQCIKNKNAKFGSLEMLRKDK